MTRLACIVVLICGSACGANMRAQDTTVSMESTPVCSPDTECALEGSASGERIAVGIVSLSVIMGGALLLQALRD